MVPQKETVGRGSTGAQPKRLNPNFKRTGTPTINSGMVKRLQYLQIHVYARMFETCNHSCPTRTFQVYSCLPVCLQLTVNKPQVLSQHSTAKYCGIRYFLPKRVSRLSTSHVDLPAAKVRFGTASLLAYLVPSIGYLPSTSTHTRGCGNTYILTAVYQAITSD